ncbi:MAG: ATP-binding cassette domain-containing protein [Bacteroidales bacterium]|nr:ATP-binding cassette domain-containing protein [Bacteroidales bacterium]MBN2757549.1 ATP-binding cassette domain-containing protein [Bacteroidales bacterium]
MNESILRALMKLFAIVANVDKDNVSQNARRIVESYLGLQLNASLVQEYLLMFDEFLVKLHKNIGKGDKRERVRTSLNSVKVLVICHEINEQLQQVEKLIVLIRLLEFIHEDYTITDKELDFVKTVAETFNVSEDEYLDAKAFIIEDNDKIKIQKKLLKINSKETKNNKILNKKSQNNDDANVYKHFYDKNITGEISILHFASTNTFILKYIGEEAIYLNSQNIIPGRAYVFETGSLIKGPRISPIYYSDVANEYIQESTHSKIVFSATDIEFKFKNSDNGIHKFSFSEESGHLIGIMGGSGVGKSTLLSVLNGSLPLNSGKITINGYDIYEDKEKIEGVIGFVPQDDLLIEELTVYQNLYYNAKLCFSNSSEEEIEELIKNILLNLDLEETKELKVGDPLNKFISGGQRKRLNIALELIREPSILIVDEPTSGLSSQDSETVMTLLKEQTIKGKLVIVNIHQPSSDIYKLFDRLLVLDKGGYPVYLGNPIDAVVYFKTASNHVNASESECGVCGNVNPEQSLQILEAKMVNEYGKYTRTRKVSPKEWYNRYLEKIDSKLEIPESEEKIPIPQNAFKIPNKFKQFKIFSIRNILSKLTNKQYLLINFLEAPLLALILAYFTKYISGTVDNPNLYLFSENENIPAYLFMAVVVALFIGLTVSAEEIIKDRRILKRESFLNLSWLSYLNSKIVVLFILSAIQSISFILVGNFVLGINGMTYYFFIILFSTMAAANLVGLNISSALNSVVTIYITIPFIIVPQLLFSGVMVNFNKLHKDFASVEYVPVIGDLMLSRWAYEAIAVTQFEYNNYEKHFFNIEKELSKSSFKSMFLLPELQSRIDRSFRNTKENGDKEKLKDDLQLLRNEFKTLAKSYPKIKFEFSDNLTTEKYDKKTSQQATSYIEELKSYLKQRQYFANLKFDKIFNSIADKLGGTDAVIQLKDENYNKRLAEFVLNKSEVKKIVEIKKHKLIQLKDPIFKDAETNYGRAHFYASKKFIFGQEIDTIWFNTAIIWLSIIFMYILLIFNGLKKFVDFVSSIKIFGNKES